MKRWAASEIDLREFEKPGNVLSRVRSVQTPSVLPLSYIHNRLGEFYLRGKCGISLEHGIELMMKFRGLKKLHGRFWKPTLVVSNPGGTPRPLWDTLCAGAQGWLKCSCWKSSSPADRRQHQAWSLAMQASEDSRGFVMCGSRSQASVVHGTLAQIWYHGCAQGLDGILLAA